MDNRERVAAVLPGYEVGEVLGQGSFGTVFAGVHRRLGRPVAVKELLPALAGDAEIRSRFLSEARLLAGFDHPHIVSLFDYVEEEGLCLLIMERLTAGTLTQLAAAGAVRPDAACAIAL